MTVQELITLLQRHDQSARVVTHGKDYGYDDLDSEAVQDIRIVLDACRGKPAGFCNKDGSCWFHGVHGEALDGEQDATVPAVVIGWKP